MSYTAAGRDTALGTFAVFQDAVDAANAWARTTANRGLRAQISDDATGSLIYLLLVRPEPPNDVSWTSI